MAEFRIVIAVSLLGLLAACGQKGPLYLPDQAHDVVTRPSGSQTPPEKSQAPDTPGTVDSPASPPNPAPEVTAPDDDKSNDKDKDKDKKEPGADAPH
jgi:predicted small lipoprotein YifL